MSQAPRLFVAGLAQETNVRGPLPTGLASFSGRFATADRDCNGDPPYPEALRARARVLAAQGRLHLLDGPAAGAHPSGPVTRLAFETLRDLILDELTRALPLDIVALQLHGAMIADGYPDCEGDLLARIRALVGPAVRVGALLDPHGHLSPAMVDAADLLVAYKEYPHTDFRERADDLLRLLLRSHYGEVTPTPALWDSGAIGIFHTNDPVVRGFVDEMLGLEANGDALSVSLNHGFLWGDGEDLGTRVLVYADGDATGADAICGRLAGRAGEIARRCWPASTPLRQALEDAVRETPTRPIVMADGADNPGGGAGGDSTFVLAALLEMGVDGACLGPLWDPLAVDIAFNVGVGARLALRIGGKTGPHAGAPIDIEATVTALSPNLLQTFAGAPFSLGRAAAISAKGIDIVLASTRDQARGPDLFRNMGIDPEQRRLIVVKSSQHFHDGFAPLASRVVYLDAPGALQATLRPTDHRRIGRPRWPMNGEGAAPWRVTAPPSPTCKTGNSQ